MSQYISYSSRGSGGGGGGGGVTSLNGQTGDLNLLAGSGVSIVPGTNTLTINATGGLANTPNKVYVNFANGSDTATGSLTQPFKTLNHAISTITTASATNPFVLMLSGGTDSFSGTISGVPNVSLFSEDESTLMGVYVITGGSTNDTVMAQNITFNAGITWIRNDASSMNLTLQDVTVESLITFEQQGSGNAVFNIRGGTISGATIQARTAYFTSVQNLTGQLNFLDVGNIGDYIMIGCDLIFTTITLNGGSAIQLSGCISDSGYGINCNTTGSGSPVIYSDAGSLPPTINGTNTLLLTTEANYINYSPAVPGNWSPAPVLVSAALDQLAARGSGSSSPYHVETFTLSSGNITSQSITLSATPDTANLTQLQVIGGVLQAYGTDFSVSGTTLSFLGDLATGGNAALVSGDKLVVQYN